MGAVRFVETLPSRSWLGAARPVACGDPAPATRGDPILQNCHKELYACRGVLACEAARGRRRLKPRDRGFGRRGPAGSPGGCLDQRRLLREAGDMVPRRATGGTLEHKLAEALPSLATLCAKVHALQHDGLRGDQVQSSARIRRRADRLRLRDAVAEARSAWRSPGSSRRARVPPWGRAGRTPAWSGLPPRHRAARNSALRPNDVSRRAHTRTAFIFTNISSLILG